MPAGFDLADRWDWREDAPWEHPIGVTPAKDQEDCGSCWAFAAVGQLEAHARIADSSLLDLSEQQCVSCNTRDASCSGGWHHDAYEVFLAPGAVAEASLPLRGVERPVSTTTALRWLASPA